MNEELIDQLAESCLIFSEDGYSTPERFDYVKFAELIVNKCIDILSEEKYNTTMLTSYPPQSSSIWNAKNNIKFYFGIK